MADNEKKIEINRDNVYDVILQQALERAKANFPKNVAEIKDEKSENTHEFTIDEYVGRMIDKYEQKGLMEDFSPANTAVRNTAFASTLAVRSMYNICVAHEINKSIDEVFQNPIYKDYLRDEVRQDLKKYVDTLMQDVSATPANKKMTENLKKSFEQYAEKPDGIKQFLNQGLNYIEEVNNNLLDKNMKPDDALKAANKAMESNEKFDKALTANLNGTMTGYMGDIKDYINIYISSNAKPVKPQDFLEHFNENPQKMTAQEKDFARDFVNQVLSIAAAKNVTYGSINRSVVCTDFKADGKQIISEAEFKKVQNNEISQDDLDCKLVAAILSGKQITVEHELKKTAQKNVGAEKNADNSAQKNNGAENKADNSAQNNNGVENKENVSTPIQINPHIEEREPQTLFELIVEFLKLMIKKVTDKQKVQQMNEKFEENKNKIDTVTAERQKMTFDELLEDSGFKKVKSAPTKEVEKVKEAEKKAKSLNEPAKGR